MKLTLKTLDGDEITCNVNLTDTVSILLSETKMTNMRLLFKGQVMDMDKTIDTYDIQKNDEIWILPKLTRRTLTRAETESDIDFFNA
jgi:hypothetical protein